MAESRPEAIAEQLRARIREGALPPGTMLNQVRLAGDLGVSRIPLREALRTLGSEGLVVLAPGHQARVVEHSRRDVVDLYDLRLSIEPRLAAEIVDRASPAAVRTLRRLAEEMLGVSDPAVWSARNHRFHDGMYGLVDRPHTLRMVRQIMGLTEPYSHAYVHDLDGLEQARREHLTMVESIEARESETLEALIRAHLQGARDVLLDALEER